MQTFIGYMNKKGFIKTVEYIEDGSLDVLGITLYDYFKDLSDVKRILKTTVDAIEEEDVYFVEDDDGINAYEEFESLEDFLESVDHTNIYYIYRTTWHVIGGSVQELTELETILDEVIE